MSRFLAWVAWLESNGMTRAAIAKRIGCSEASMSRLVNGSRSAGFRLAHRIEAASADWAYGPIRAREWLSGPREHDESLPRHASAGEVSR
jgi:transcriptional regulator with XRE-family HTH domain